MAAGKGTADAVVAVAQLALFAGVAYAAWKIYQTFAGKAAEVKRQVVNQAAVVAGTPGAVETALGGLPQDDLALADIRGAGKVYDPKLDPRGTFERLFTMPPASAFRYPDTSLTGSDNATGGLF